jgi:hypothetical protein
VTLKSTVGNIEGATAWSELMIRVAEPPGPQIGSAVAVDAGAAPLLPVLVLLPSAPPQPGNPPSTVAPAVALANAMKARRPGERTRGASAEIGVALVFLSAISLSPHIGHEPDAPLERHDGPSRPPGLRIFVMQIRSCQTS